MSVSGSGVLESLIAMAIWFVLVGIVARVRKRLLSEDKNDESIFEILRQRISEITDPGFLQDLNLSIIVIMNRYQRQLNSQIRGVVVSVIIYLWAVYNVNPATSKTGYDYFLLSLLYIPLIGFELYEIKRMENRIDKLDLCVLEGISVRKFHKLK